MKPRIRKIRGLWVCFQFGVFGQKGIGYTPEKAYQDWLSRIVSCGV